MECPLNLSVSLTKIKPRKLLIKSGKQAFNTDERISRDQVFKSLSTMESDGFNNSERNSWNVSRTSRNTRLLLTVEEHPLFLNLNQKQVKTYYDFVSMANTEFESLTDGSQKLVNM